MVFKMFWRHHREMPLQEMPRDEYRRIQAFNNRLEQHRGRKESCPNCLASGQTGEFENTPSFSGICFVAAILIILFLTTIFFGAPITK